LMLRLLAQILLVRVFALLVVIHGIFVVRPRHSHFPGHVQSPCFGVVTAPSDAEETVAAYLAITPFSFSRLRGDAFRPRKSAFTSKRRDSTSKTMVSPSSTS